MRTTKPIWVALVAGYVSLALGDEPARAVAFGYAGSIVHLDVLRNGDSEVEPGGLGVLGRIDVHGAWGLQLGYSRKDDGTGGGGEIFLAQSGLYGYYAWEGQVSDTDRLRFYPKVGVAYTDFEETVPMTGTFSDGAIGPSVGFGVEWGGTRWGAVFDVGWTFVDVELSPGQEESLTVSAGFIGLIYCF